MRVWQLALGLLVGSGLAGAATFEEVKPILQENCVKCHGGSKTKGGFRMTDSVRFKTGGYGGLVVDPAKLEDSLLLKMISWVDEDHQMPPKKQLPAEKIATLKSWVLAGAPYPDDVAIEYVRAPGEEEEMAANEINEVTRKYWAFQKPQRHDLPKLKDAAWARQPIDYFIKAKLEEQGLEPVGEATRQQWIRRAYYDLIGLPPSVAEVEAFVNDSSDTAHEKVIDRLLAMPQYGEKWGRHWLDVVRFGESNGYERDKLKPEVWRYRDYVISAFNQDKPYDRFVTEQLAGDELPNADAEAIAATGYYHLGLYDDDPADPKLATYDGFDDVLKTTTEGMLGVTIACARCHSHKIDPFPQDDYYRILAFFRNVKQMSGRGGDYGVLTTVKTAGHERDAAAIAKRQAEVDARLKELRETAMQRWRSEQKDTAAGTGQAVYLPNGSGADGQEWRYVTAKPADAWYGLTFDDKTWQKGISGFGTKGTPGAKVRTTWQGKDLWLRRSFRMTEVPKAAQWHLHHDEDVTIYLNGIPAASFSGYTTGYENRPLSKDALEALQVGKNVIAVHCKQTIGGQYVDVGIVNQGRSAGNLQPKQVLAQHGKTLLGADLYAEFQGLEKEQAALNSKKAAAGTKYLAVTEKGMQKTFLLRRGNPSLEGKEVQPGFPAILGFPDPQPTPRNNSSGRRTALAEWITHPDNPLTARVMANRVWQHHFGRGIVATPGDFGNLGAKPTHPELLDWLATELVRNNWQLKPLHKMLMLSSAYRMSVVGRESSLVQDPGNDWFWRFNPRRLTAEEIRDSILHTAGRLNLKQGGPSIYPELAEAVLKTASNNKWGTSSPEEQRRRSIYVMTRRSLLVPILTDHDKADTDNPCPVRFSSILPTQALGMLNSDFVNNEAIAFAERLRQERPNNLREQVASGFEHTFHRRANSQEVERGMAFVAEMQREEGLSPEAALDRFALLLLNLNEFVFVD